jgi:glycosyltransferase involved in cell wall biosynthesis
MKPFMNAHADVVLLAAWHNQWKQSMDTMKNSWLIDATKPFEGIQLDRIIMLPPIPNSETPKIYAQAHVGLFPNRCEAGTNMVMTEFMACGRAVIATRAHGHLDVLKGEGPYLVAPGSLDPAGWSNPNVSDVLWRLEQAYNERDTLTERGLQCSEAVAGLTWDDCARKITAEIS